MMSNNKPQRARTVFAKKSSVIATEIALALMAAQIAYAQQPPEQAAPQQQPAAQPARTAAAEQVERIEITGTRIPQVNVEGATPITTLNAQDIKFDGHAKAEDLLNQLPQVYTSQGSASSNGATGTANVNLRNLGPTRNLVLVNGRRLPPGSPRSGSDSYAADLNHSFYNHQQHNSVSGEVSTAAANNPSQFAVPGDVSADGKIKNISLLMGGNFAGNKGNATLFFNYKQEDPVLQSSRDFSACALGSRAAGTAFRCAGSFTSFPGSFIPDVNNPDGPVFTIDRTTGQPRDFNTATDLFNFGPYNYYRRPSEQYGFSAFAHLDVTPKVRAYSEFNFHDNHTVAQIAPSGIFIGAPDFLGSNAIHFENPFLTPQWKALIAANNGGAPFGATGDTAEMLIGRRNFEGGNRQDDIRHTSYRGVLGVKGEMFNNWNYDIYGQSGKVVYQGVYRNEFSKTRALRAIDVVPGPGGTPTCRSALPDPNTGIVVDPLCVPYNIWSLGQVTPAALSYLTMDGFQEGYTSQTVVSGTASADLAPYGIKMPGAKNGVGVVVGVEQRKERLVLETDTAFSTNDLAGQGGATIGVAGSLNVNEYFGEVRVPLIEGKPFADQFTIS